jgi:phospholipid/cholesterol/gamma-HCH transport system permease protein
MQNYFKNLFTSSGNFTNFNILFFKELVIRPFEWNEFVTQCYKVGYTSLPLVGVTGFIMGLVLTIQSRPVLTQFGAESWLPSMVGLSLIKEIAPVITALICAGKIASGIGAELGSMKVTEKIDAMEVSAMHPFPYLVITRVMATTLMIPILVFFADAIGIFGGYLGANIHSEIHFTRYITKVLESIDFIDILPATIKSFFFGYVIGIIGCYKGYHANNGTASVGIAANSAEVTASLGIFIIDMIAVQITDLFI